METDLWKEILARLGRGETIAVATIATRDGSAPRSAGAKMTVGPEGLAAGTLGGGPAEAMALREAEKTLADGLPRLFSIDMSGTALSGADLICGGTVRIFVHLLAPDSLNVVRTVCDRMRLGLSSFLLTPVDGAGPPELVPPESVDPELAKAIGENDGAQLLRRRGAEYLFEPLPARTRLVLAGGGHVSLATAQTAAITDFEVTVLDDREEFVAPARFPWIRPDRLRVVSGFRDCLSEATLGFPVGATCCVAILTRGHSFDGEVLAQALSTPAGYVGMIGSRRKRDAIYEAMANRGFSQRDLERIHSPIGLSIGAETPEEIAVSIVAELIAERAKGLREFGGTVS